MNKNKVLTHSRSNESRKVKSNFVHFRFFIGLDFYFRSNKSNILYTDLFDHWVCPGPWNSPEKIFSRPIFRFSTAMAKAVHLKVVYIFVMLTINDLMSLSRGRFVWLVWVVLEVNSLQIWLIERQVAFKISPSCSIVALVAI